MGRLQRRPQNRLGIARTHQNQPAGRKAEFGKARAVGSPRLAVEHVLPHPDQWPATGGPRRQGECKAGRGRHIALPPGKDLVQASAQETTAERAVDLRRAERKKRRRTGQRPLPERGKALPERGQDVLGITHDVPVMFLSIGQPPAASQASAAAVRCGGGNRRQWISGSRIFAVPSRKSKSQPWSAWRIWAADILP